MNSILKGVVIVSCAALSVWVIAVAIIFFVYTSKKQSKKQRIKDSMKCTLIPFKPSTYSLQARAQRACAKAERLTAKLASK